MSFISNLQKGKHIKGNKYEIIDKISDGTFGSVYTVSDVQAQNKKYF